MRHTHRHMRNPRHHSRRIRVRPLRRGGRFLGMIGLAVLGYSLLEKNREKQTRMQSDVFVDWEKDNT